jgi:hypothetical protein
MHEAALVSAALPAPTNVLGLLLQPYALGHELFLIREQNPLATVGAGPESWEQARLPDLAQAVLICCQGWEANRRAWRDPLITLKLWLWGRRVRRAEFGDALIAFRAYQLVGSQEFPESPTLEEPSKYGPAPRVLGAPFLLRLHQFLVMKLRLSEARAWDYPYGLAKMQWETWWETKGGLKILNVHEAEHLAFVARMEAEAAAKLKAEAGQPKEEPCPA